MNFLTKFPLFYVASVSHLLAFLLFLHSPVQSIYDPKQPMTFIPTVHPEYVVDFPSAVSFYVEAMQGGYPLLGLVVLVVIERPNMVTPLPLFLQDDGRLADKRQRDGVYSARFIDYNAKGRYAYKFMIRGKDSLPRLNKKLPPFDAAWIVSTKICSKGPQSPHAYKLVFPLFNRRFIRARLGSRD